MTTYTDSSEIQLVKFEAPWCGPCTALQKTLETISGGLKYPLTHVNIDDDPDTAKRFGVRGLPTLALIKDGVVLASKTGGMNAATVRAFLDVHA